MYMYMCIYIYLSLSLYIYIYIYIYIYRYTYTAREQRLPADGPTTCPRTNSVRVIILKLYISQV